MSEVLMQIGEVADRTELSIRTVRHYEDIGLITPSERSAGGFRLYTDSDIERLLVIRRMKPLGFSLAQMRELLDAFDSLNAPNGHTSAAETVRRCQEQLDDATRKLQRNLAYADELQSVLAELLL